MVARRPHGAERIRHPAGHDGIHRRQHGPSRPHRRPVGAGRPDGALFRLEQAPLGALLRQAFDVRRVVEARDRGRRRIRRRHGGQPVQQAVGAQPLDEGGQPPAILGMLPAGLVLHEERGINEGGPRHWTTRLEPPPGAVKRTAKFCVHRGGEP